MVQSARAFVPEKDELPTPSVPVPTTNRSLVGLLGVISCVLLAIYHWQFVAENTVDIPRADEWHYFDEPGPHFQPNPTWEWLISSNGSHRILFTRLMIWVHYFWDGMNFGNIQVLNFAMFFATIMFFMVLKRVTLGANAFPLFPLLLLFLLSPIAYENHIWPYQSQIHFLLLFTLLGAYFGFKPHRKPIDDVWFTLACVSAAYSFSCGVGIAAAYVAMFALRHFSEFLRGKRDWLGVARLVVVCFVVGYSLNRWREGFVRLQTVSILDPLFGKFLLNLVSLGHGFDVSASLIPGDVIMLLLSAASVVLLLRDDEEARASMWMWGALGWATIAALATITFGRGGNYGGDFTGAKYSRYAEVSFVLIPAIGVLWWQTLKKWPLAQHIFLVAYLFSLAAAYRDNWEFQYYPLVAKSRRENRECVKLYFTGDRPDGACPDVDPTPLGPRLRYAEELGIHFAASLREEADHERRQRRHQRVLAARRRSL